MSGIGWLSFIDIKCNCSVRLLRQFSMIGGNNRLPILLPGKKESCTFKNMRYLTEAEILLMIAASPVGVSKKSKSVAIEIEVDKYFLFNNLSFIYTLIVKLDLKS